MSHGENSRVAQSLLSTLARGAEPEQLASLLSVDAQFQVSGNIAVLPWIGKHTGREAASDFIRDTRRDIEPLRFDVHEVLVSDRRAVILGELLARVRATGRRVESTFALVLTVSGGVITHFQMLAGSLPGSYQGVADTNVQSIRLWASDFIRVKGSIGGVDDDSKR